METLTRLVSESLARHGFDRPVDYRRLQWSRWFRCESHHSLLVVPSKPGVFALADEIIDFGAIADRIGHDFSRAENPALQCSASPAAGHGPTEGHTPSHRTAEAGTRQPEADSSRRMLAVTQFFEDEDMAFVLDRMLSRQNRMRERLASGRYFFRFVVIEDRSQRQSVCGALNQWILSAAEMASGIGSHFATSLELTPEPPNTGISGRADVTDSITNRNRIAPPGTATGSRLNSAVPTTIHCSSSFPSGF